MLQTTTLIDLSGKYLRHRKANGRSLYAHSYASVYRKLLYRLPLFTHKAGRTYLNTGDALVK
jgi:hypothetical protein